jgi:hypothetical protein
MVEPPCHGIAPNPTEDVGHTSQIGWPREHLLPLVATWGSTYGGGSSELCRDVGGGGRRSAMNVEGGGGGHIEVSSGGSRCRVAARKEIREVQRLVAMAK